MSNQDSNPASSELLAKISQRKEEVMTLNAYLKKQKTAKQEKISQQNDQLELNKLNQILNQ